MTGIFENEEQLLAVFEQIVETFNDTTDGS